MARTRQQAREPTRRSERVQAAKTATIKKEEVENPTKITKKKRFSRKQQPQRCRLLKLPGELRNKIYRYALLEPQEIAVTPKAFSQPALLRTCRRLRKEAGGVYYYENDFTLKLESYNGAAYVPFARQYYNWDYRTFPIRGEGKVCFRFEGPPSWENLVEWIKAEHYQNAMLPAMDDPFLGYEFIVGGALKIVEASRGWQPWEFKEKALEGFYHGLKGTRSRWVKAEERGWRID